MQRVQMTVNNEIYKCKICGNVIAMVRAGKGQLVCCSKPMELLQEKADGDSAEKHVPVIEDTDKGYKVKVGSSEHPMEESHYIEWIELIADGTSYRRFLKPGARPEAEFCLSAEAVTAREHCNLHGLWKSS